MIGFVLRRLVSVIPVLLLVAVFAFLLVHLTPGDPAAYMLGPLASQAQINALRRALGLNEPILVQLGHWFGRVLRGDLGDSFFMGIPVPLAISQRLEPTALLTVLAVAFELVIGIPAGILAARRRNTWVDQVVIGFASLGICTPSFWLGLNLILLFGVTLHLLPVAGYVPVSESWTGAVRSVLMPAFALGAINSALVARMTRASMLETLSQDFVRTARAKGLSRRPVIRLHALPNALLPVITLSGVLLGFVLAGSIPVERAFGTPGLGYAMFTAVSERDVFVMQNLVFLYACVFVLLNILVDLTIAWLDPRIRYR